MDINEKSTDFTDILNNAIDIALSKINTSFIGQIKAINDDDTISILPVLKRQVGDNIFQLPIIEDVEFLQNYSTDGYSALEFKIDDYVLCISLQRNHTNFFDTLEVALPANRRKLDIADIVALPYFFSSKKKIEDKIKGWSAKSNTSIKLSYKDSGFIEIVDDKLKIELAGVNVLDTISKALDAVSKATVTTPDGTFPINNASDFIDLKSQIDKIKG